MPEADKRVAGGLNKIPVLNKASVKRAAPPREVADAMTAAVNSASETIWGTIDVQAGALIANQKPATQDEARIEKMQPTKHR